MRKSIVVTTIVLASATPALAYTPTGLPWDGPLTTLINGLQGGLAHAMLATGIIIAGIGWTFWQEFGPAAKALVGRNCGWCTRRRGAQHHDVSGSGGGDPLMRARVHQSMVRVPLLGGGHPRLTMINVVLALAILSTGLHWWTITLAIGVALSVQWALRAAAQRHPEWPIIYLRHLLEPAIRPAHGRAWGTPEKPKPTVPPLPRWTP